LDGHLSLRLGHRQLVDDDKRTGLKLLGEGRAQRAALDFLWQTVIVAARLRTEHRAAFAPQRVPDLADTGAPSALLAPRFLAAAAHKRPVLRRMGATPRRGLLAHDRLPDDARVHAPAKHIV